MIKFEVKNRFSGDVQFVAEIDCAADAPVSIKLRLAVLWAIKSRANLSGVDLSRANLISGGHRSDGHQFFAIREPDGTVKVRAGCRYFTLAEARAHWSATRAGTRLGDESLAIVDHLERMAVIAGWIEAKPKVVVSVPSRKKPVRTKKRVAKRRAA